MVDTHIDIAFSPCPNDTFIFHAMLHGLVNNNGLNFKHHMDDIEALNKKAVLKTFHVTKLSFFAYLKLKQYYEILDAGSALGFGCGPLLICKDPGINLETAKIAIPGELTTANLLLKLWNPKIKRTIVTRFDNILPGVKSGEFDAGLIIHESRFVYREFALKKIIDLGFWWEQETGQPIPLGCIAIRKDNFLINRKKDIESTIKNSITFALNNRDASTQFIKTHAQELDDTVIKEHINLYVNDFTLCLGEKGRKAIKILEEMAKWKKIV
ncbi:MAG: 1,4-dihydroxy-6-naphthoate synthase [Desulfobacula sp.]|nr:1,4-dihydroxy-6-naphthoate synthase [Desulfobacula sp.]